MSFTALVTSDWHTDWTTVGMRRFDDLRLAVWETVERAKALNVDAYLFTGDLCNPDSGSCVMQCLELALMVGCELGKHGIQSVWLAGNHDVIEDGTGNTSLSPLRALAKAMLPVHVIERPQAIALSERVTLLGLPYTAQSHGYDPQAFVEGFARDGTHKGKTILVAGHLMIQGIIPGVETTDMPRGRDVVFPTEAVDMLLGEHVSVNGHYHEQQSFKGIHIPGSLERLTFGEEKSPKGWLMIEVS